MLIAAITATLYIGVAMPEYRPANALHVPRIPVEVWRTGDDSATIKFVDEVNAAFIKSDQFRLTNSETPGSLVISIPSHVTVNERRVEWVRFRVEVSRRAQDGNLRLLGQRNGRCRMGHCGERVVDVAKAMLAKVKPLKREATTSADP